MVTTVSDGFANIELAEFKPTIFWLYDALCELYQDDIAITLEDGDCWPEIGVKAKSWPEDVVNKLVAAVVAAANVRDCTLLCRYIGVNEAAIALVINKGTAYDLCNLGDGIGDRDDVRRALIRTKHLYCLKWYNENVKSTPDIVAAVDAAEAVIEARDNCDTSAILSRVTPNRSK
mgnify:CR=1 FL=1